MLTGMGFLASIPSERGFIAIYVPAKWTSMCHRAEFMAS
jgi:hypothetical protein